MTTADIVAFASLGAGVVCFGLYVWEAVVVITAKPMAHDLAATPEIKAAIARPAVSVKDVTDLIAASAKLTDSLAKAGPALTSLIGAILFLAIAAISSGAISGSPVPPQQQAPAKSNAPPPAMR